MIKKTLLFCFLFLLNKSNLIACKCFDPETIEEAYESTYFVSHGKILSKNFVPVWISLDQDKIEFAKENFKLKYPNETTYDTEVLIKIEVEIIKLFKGENIKDTITIFTARKGGSCGFTRFETGKEFIIYANKTSYFFSNIFSELSGFEKQGTYWTNQCSRTTEYHAEEAIALEELSTKNHYTKYLIENKLEYSIPSHYKELSISALKEKYSDAAFMPNIEYTSSKDSSKLVISYGQNPLNDNEYQIEELRAMYEKTFRDLYPNATWLKTGTKQINSIWVGYFETLDETNYNLVFFMGLEGKQVHFGFQGKKELYSKISPIANKIMNSIKLKK